MLKACQEFGGKIRGKLVRRTTPRYATRLKTPRRTWDRKGVHQVCILYKAGRTITAIGRRLGLTPKQTNRAVEAAIRLALIEPRPRRRQWTDEELLVICRTRDQENGVISTAAKLGTSLEDVRSALGIARTRGLRRGTGEKAAETEDEKTHDARPTPGSFEPGDRPTDRPGRTDRRATEPGADVQAKTRGTEVGKSPAQGRDEQGKGKTR